MCVAAAILGGSVVVGGALSAKGSKDAAKAQQAATNAASSNSLAAQTASIDEQRRQYDQTRSDFSPYRYAGYGALNQLSRLYGIQMPAYQEGGQNPVNPTPQSPQSAGAVNGDYGFRGTMNRLAERSIDDGRMMTEKLFANRVPNDGYSTAPGYSTPSVTGGPDMSGFFASPDYNFRRQEGMRDIGNSFAARGGAFSGNALKALSEYNSNLAAGEYGNYFNRLAGIVNAGQGGTAQTAAAGSNMANNISSTLLNTAGQVGNNLIAGGNARASGIQGQYNALGDSIGFLGGLAGSYYGARPRNVGISGPRY